ncbi:MAG: hypothetical protein ABIW96_08375 [Polaromonas sp.]
MRARPVGSAASDIDLVFDAADRPGTVTALLAACVSDADGQTVDEDEVWGWTLNQRLQALLAMRLASGDTRVDLQSNCTQCGEAMEIGLDLQAFAGEPVAPRFTWRSADGLALSLRLPKGHDLRDWMRDGGQVLQEALLASLVEDVSGQPQPLSTLLPELDDAFEAHDPLTALHLSAACPACAHVNTVGCDLEALLLDGFARAQAGMLDDVVKLASTFHWSEAAILALPRWRRARYLRQISQGDWA